MTPPPRADTVIHAKIEDGGPEPENKRLVFTARLQHHLVAFLNELLKINLRPAINERLLDVAAVTFGNA